MPSRKRSLVRCILIAGVVAGALDILDPIVFYYLRSHVAPVRILQSVAAGWLGRAAYSGGFRTAIVGLALHFCIAIFWAAVFVLVARAVPVRKRYVVVSGMLYGAFIYAVMNFVVLPRTHAPVPAMHFSAPVMNGICAVVFLVGVPIAVVARRMS